MTEKTNVAKRLMAEKIELEKVANVAQRQAQLLINEYQALLRRHNALRVFNNMLPAEALMASITNDLNAIAGAVQQIHNEAFPPKTGETK